MTIYSLDDMDKKLLELGYAPNSQFKTLMNELFEREKTKIHNTQSHVRHSYGVAQVFLNEYPDAIAIIKSSPQSNPFDLKSSPILQDFKDFIKDKTGSFGPNQEYSFDTFRKVIPENLGGDLPSGGGGAHEFKTALRLVAEIM